MSRRGKFVVAFSLAVAGIVSFWPNASATLQTNSSKTKYTVDIDLDETIVLPQLCNGRLLRRPITGERLGYDGRTRVSVSVGDADEVPLNYDYSVTGGGVYAKGPNGTWDLATSPPGKYQITVTVDDGVGNSGRSTKTVNLAEPSFTCPCTCPAIEVASHYTEVKPGDTVDFEVRTFGGDFVRGPKYYWHVEKGTLVSGQGTQVINVKATGAPGEKVIAHAEIGGIDPSCLCSQVASESVAIGDETKSRTIPLAIHGLSLDEETVYIDCPPGELPRRGGKSSEDLVVAVQTSATSNSVNDKLNYTYAITGGKITGSGSQVKWNLVGLHPGIYWISVGVDDGTTVTEVTKKAVTLAFRDCGGDVFCPKVEFSEIRRAKNSDDLIISAFIDVASEFELTWDAKGAEVIAGQGSRLVRLRPLKAFRHRESTVTLEIQYPPEVMFCPREFTRKLGVPAPSQQN